METLPSRKWSSLSLAEGASHLLGMGNSKNRSKAELQHELQDRPQVCFAFGSPIPRLKRG